MPLRNTVERYGWLIKLLHWTMALIIIALLTIGILLDDMPVSPDKIKLIGLHKSFGISILALVMVRFLWRSVNVEPALPADMPLWQKFGAHATHYGLYALMFLIPLVGWLMSSAYGFPVQYFNVVQLPDLIGADRSLAGLLREWHGWLAYSLLALAGLHAAAALYHHFVRKDDILKRMLPFGKE